MSEEPSERRNWTDGELDLIVADYFLMLNDEAARVPFNNITPRREDIERLVRKFNPVERDFRNRKLGREGEELVLHFERERLKQRDRSDLAKKIRWISEEDGDGAGYDILSFDEKGKERFLEVKTTVGADTTPFYITRNELSLSSERPEAFRLCRVFDFSIRPRMFELAPPLTNFIHL